jgi:hypothetical protein
MIPKSNPSALIRGFGKDHAQRDIAPDFAVLKRRRML